MVNTSTQCRCTTDNHIDYTRSAVMQFLNYIYQYICNYYSYTADHCDIMLINHLTPHNLYQMYVVYSYILVYIKNDFTAFDAPIACCCIFIHRVARENSLLHGAHVARLRDFFKHYINVSLLLWWLHPYIYNVNYVGCAMYDSTINRGLH